LQVIFGRKGSKFIELEDKMDDEFFSFEDGYEWEGEMPLPEDWCNEEVELENMIYKYAPGTVGKGRIAGAVIVFEFIAPDGRMMASVIHPNKITKKEVASLLYEGFVGLNDDLKRNPRNEDDMPYDPKDF
jgi:hypothetical protein